MSDKPPSFRIEDIDRIDYETERISKTLDLEEGDSFELSKINPEEGEFIFKIEKPINLFEIGVDNRKQAVAMYLASLCIYAATFAVVGYYLPMWVGFENIIVVTLVYIAARVTL